MNLLSKSDACIIAQELSSSGILLALDQYFSSSKQRKVEVELIFPFSIELITRQFEQVLIEL